MISNPFINSKYDTLTSDISKARVKSTPRNLNKAYPGSLDRNVHASRIQAVVVGNATRLEEITKMRKEILDLRQMVGERDGLVSEYLERISSRDLVIQDLKQKLSSDTISSLSSRSSLFTNQSDSKSIQSLGDEFYNVNLRSDDLIPRSLPTPPSPKWAAKSDLNAKEADTESMRKIWSPVANLNIDKPAPPKSHPVTGTLTYENTFSDRTSYPSTQFSEAGEMKTNFKFLVEKIVKTNDQPSSIFLQQRLRVETTEIKSLIFDSIMLQLLPLMKNRFGNFLVQCCLECGSDDQFNALCLRMRGHVVQLSCDRFGCHVMQKAIFKVREDIKYALIIELFAAIQDTFTHRFACHVWQRVFEIKWKSEKRQIMEIVQSTMAGQWDTIANDENGSLIVQCIFEHCSYSDKLPIISEIFNYTYDIARGQWGNWVIQHLLEHGSVLEQSHVIQVVLQNVFTMSIDQYASKVVEKCVKIATKRDLHLFVEQIITTTTLPTPHILAMMNNQYGNYVVQNILSIAESAQREQCVSLIEPHVAILKASKYGQRVASLCEKYSRS